MANTLTCRTAGAKRRSSSSATVTQVHPRPDWSNWPGSTDGEAGAPSGVLPGMAGSGPAGGAIRARPFAGVGPVPTVTSEVNMAGAATATTGHETIQRWAEAHGGHPARVKGTGRGKDPGMLRIDFPGFSAQRTLEGISWPQFFEWLDR